MEQTPLQDQAPQPELFTLGELYLSQPPEVVLEHVDLLMRVRLLGMHAIQQLTLEQQDRKVGLETVPDGFDEIHEALEDWSDQDIAESIDSQRLLMADVILQLGAARGAVRRIKRGEAKARARGRHAA
jgi:hypothetical protein